MQKANYDILLYEELDCCYSQRAFAVVVDDQSAGEVVEMSDQAYGGS